MRSPYDIEVLKTKLDCKKLEEIILKKETEIIKKYSPFGDGGTGLGLNSLTSRFNSFNVLKWSGTKSLANAIKNGYEQYNSIKDKSIYVKCWANVMRKGQKISPHHHSFGNILPEHYLCGTLIVKTDGSTSSFYDKNKSIKNHNGDINLFQSHVVHSTNPYVGDSERISINFDIYSQDYLINAVPWEKRDYCFVKL